MLHLNNICTDNENKKHIEIEKNVYWHYSRCSVIHETFKDNLKAINHDKNGFGNKTWCAHKKAKQNENVNAPEGNKKRAISSRRTALGAEKKNWREKIQWQMHRLANQVHSAMNC